MLARWWQLFIPCILHKRRAISPPMHLYFFMKKSYFKRSPSLWDFSDFHGQDYIAIPHFNRSLELQKNEWQGFILLGRKKVQSLSRVQLFATPWTAACQVSLSITNSWSLLKLMSIELVMPSNHLIFCWPLLLMPLIFPSIRVFSNESVLYIRWPKSWCFSFNINPFKEYSRLISFYVVHAKSLAQGQVSK